MYKRLDFDNTKKYYQKIVKETLEQTKELAARFPDIPMYQSIYNQIKDIQENLIDKRVYFSENQIFKRYSLGAIAVKNFDLRHEEYAQRLSDIFGGAIEYPEMPEE